MADNQHNQKNDQKPGLSWSQPGTQQPLKSTAPANAPKDSTGRVISIIIGIVIVFALLAWGIVALHNRSNPGSVSMATSTEATSSDTSAAPATQNQTEVTTTVAPESGNGSVSFTIPTPQDAGLGVSAENLSLTKPTWLIVYETRDGKPGTILGAGLFFPGNTIATIPLLRATASGQKYLVSAAFDNGDHVFSLKDDALVMDQSGSQMWTSFQTR